MLWLKLLHISAVIVWCGALLYLPALIAAAAAPNGSGTAPERGDGQLLRAFYANVATPAALVAIVSGTWIFATSGLLAPWLMAKLGLVGLLALGHGVCGMLVLRNERGENTGLVFVGRVVTATTLLWLIGIAWLVLSKPELP